MDPIRPRPSLLRVLRATDGIAVSLGVAVGAGILATPGTVAAYLASSAAVVGVWLLGGLFVLGDSVVLGELAARRPGAGGHYVYLRDAYGRRAAFLFGWCATFLTYPASVAGLAAKASEYAQRLGLPGAPVGLLTILGPALVHAIGVRTGSRAQNLLSYGKVTALLAFAGAIALFAPDRAPAAATLPATVPGLIGLALALQLVLWSYDGYADTVFLAEEVKHPERSVPRALLVSVAILTVVYVALNLGFLYCLGHADMARSSLAAADAAGRLAGPRAVRVVEALALFTVVGAAAATLFSGPRIAFAMARDGLLFAPFTRVSERGTPTTALASMTVLALVYWRLHSFEQIVTYTIFVIWVFVTLTTASLFVFRRRERNVNLRFTAPFFPWLPAGLLLVALAFLAGMMASAPESVGIGLVLIALGLVTYEFWSRRHPPPPVAASD